MLLKDIGCLRNIRCLKIHVGATAGRPYIVGTSETSFLGLFPQLYSSRLDIGCLSDIRCLGKLLFGEMRIEQTVLALPKDIGCFRNIRCLKKIVEQTCVFYPVPMCSPLMLHTITTRFVGYDGIFFSAIL